MLPSLVAAQRRAAGPWLTGWSDALANVKASSPCVRTADLFADGEYRLIAADTSKTLHIFKGLAAYARCVCFIYR